MTENKTTESQDLVADGQKGIRLGANLEEGGKARHEREKVKKEKCIQESLY